MSMKNSNSTIGNRTSDLPTYSTVPQPTVLPRAPHTHNVKCSLYIPQEYHILKKSLSTLMHFSHLGMSLKITSWQRQGSCTCNHSWTAISTSSLQWNWQPPKCRVTGQSSETSSSTSVAFTYRVIHKSLRDFWTRLCNNQDRHSRKEHINK